MLTRDDVKGACAMIITPCKKGAADWDVTDSVDLEATAQMIEELVQAGIGSIAACGTTGEGASLLWEEKQAFVDTIVQVNRGRVPVFAGATALGTKEVVRQMHGLKETGADGVYVGLPLWQTPTLWNSVQFYADLGDAMPDMPVMVYANPMFFKSTFPVDFWAGIAQKAPTVVACKMVGEVDTLLDKLKVAGHQVSFLPGETAAYKVYDMVGNRDVVGLWSNALNMGPEPVVAYAEAIRNGDRERIDAVYADLRSIPGTIPEGKFEEFQHFNGQAMKANANSSGFVKAGGFRAPYYDFPEDWATQSDLRGKAWAELRKKYAKSAV